MLLFAAFLAFLLAVSGTISTNEPVSELVPKVNQLIYGNGQSYTPEMIKESIQSAFNRAIRLDPFCTAMMEAINKQDAAIEGYFQFIFDQYEHSANHFYPELPESWDFLLNQSFIQYIELKVAKEQENEIENIVKRLILPKYPILEEVKYEFDVRAFAEGDIGFRGDLTGHFEEVQTFFFFLQFKNAILVDETKIKTLLTAARKGLRPEAQPYVDFLMNIPLEVMRTVYFPFKVFSTDFEHALKKFVVKSIYFDLNRKSPEVIEEVMKKLSGYWPEMKYFKFLMKFYETISNSDGWLIISDPLEYYLIQATKNGNYEMIKNLKKSLNFLKREHVKIAFDLALEKDDAEAIELLLDEKFFSEYNSIGVNLFNQALEKDKRRVLESFFIGRLNRPSLQMMGDSMLKLFENGNFDQLLYILANRYKPGLKSENLIKILNLAIETRNEKIIKRILFNESGSDALIYEEHIRPAVAQVLNQEEDLELMKLFVVKKELLKNLELNDFLHGKFLKALSDKKIDLISFYLDHDCIDEDLIFNRHMDAIEKGNEDEIDLFECYVSYKYE